MATANRIVIGLDYGTTYTGVAFRSVRAGIPEDLVLVIDWPEGQNTEKVPSVISYTPSPLGREQWGYDIEPNSLNLVWSKLELETQGRVDELKLISKTLSDTGNLDFGAIRQARGLPSYPARDIEDIIGDYLSRIRERLWINLLQTFPPAVLTSFPIDLVVTVPATWSESARNLTFRSVCKGGFDTAHFPGLRPMIMITEPEAAFHSLIRDLRPLFGEVGMLPGESFVVCDAGGGTVDLSSYRITQIDPTFTWTEIAVPGGDRCGAIFIDRSFSDWLERKLGPENFQHIVGRVNNVGLHNAMESPMVAIMRDFQQIKKRFAGIGHPAGDFISLPNPLNDYSDPANGIEGGEIRITDRDLQEIFKFCVDRTIELIASQIGQVSLAGSTVRYVFISGGFAASEYLYNEVDMFLRARRIRLKRPENPWPAVVQGAVARGVELDETNLVRVLKCTRHYGIAVSQTFSRFHHSDADVYIDPFDGQKKAKNQMIWLVKKGDGIFSNQQTHPSINLCRKFGVAGPNIFRTALVSSQEEIAPSRLTDVPIATREIAVLNYDFDDLGPGQFETVRAVGRRERHLVANFKIELRLEKAGMKFVVSCNGEDIRAVSVRYES